MRIEVRVETDEKGFLDRKCPHENCGEHFKVLLKDWKDKVPDAKAYCPICGGSARSTEWNTPEQERSFSDQAHNHVSQLIADANEKDVSAFNSRQPSGGFISMRMEHRRGLLLPTLPSRARDAFEQEFQCEQCACQYSSVGAAFFCPACGHNSAGSQYWAALEAVRKLLDGVEELRAHLEQSVGRDGARDIVRLLVENTATKLVGSFQRFAEVRYSEIAGQIPRRNVFQGVAAGSDLWLAVTGSSYESLIGPTDLATISRLFQQRHLFAHRDGIVDQDYVDRSGDRRFSPGQRLIVSVDEVRRVLDVLDRLARGMSNGPENANSGHDPSLPLT
ncbi:MAG: hypothetical protein JSS66_17005 [Armatimonadetes bacterium]|nr:hypothetical protein [Armatimonadota bacterium]